MTTKNRRIISVLLFSTWIHSKADVIPRGRGRQERNVHWSVQVHPWGKGQMVQGGGAAGGRWETCFRMRHSNGACEVDHPPSESEGRRGLQVQSGKPGRRGHDHGVPVCDWSVEFLMLSFKLLLSKPLFH